ncbi:MAG TPA: RidA family protein [Flavobacterium sp.]|jgi:enamine deaminase RidA (YjgF/YER057c/UK114 family)
MKNHFFAIILIVAVFQQLNAQNPVQKEKWHWNNTKQDTIAGYTQVLKIDNIIYISGTVALDLSEKGIEDLYRALEVSLRSYGATFQNVVKENLFTTDIEAMKKLNHIRKKFYKKDYPAATWTQIDRLYMEEAKVEVELIAHLPK